MTARKVANLTVATLGAVVLRVILMAHDVAWNLPR